MVEGRIGDIEYTRADLWNWEAAEGQFMDWTQEFGWICTKDAVYLSLLGGITGMSGVDWDSETVCSLLSGGRRQLWTFRLYLDNGARHNMTWQELMN